MPGQMMDERTVETTVSRVLALAVDGAGYGVFDEALAEAVELGAPVEALAAAGEGLEVEWERAYSVGGVGDAGAVAHGHGDR